MDRFLKQHYMETMHAYAESAPTCLSAEVLDDGSISLPAHVRDALNLQAGDSVVLELSGDTLTVRSLDSVVRGIQAKYKAQPGEALASEALIAERRREARIEEEGR